MSDALHLVRLVFDRRALSRIAAKHRLPPSVDDGYFLHAGLAQLFATSNDPAKIPFRSFALDDTHEQAQQRKDLLFVLGYTEHSQSELEALMAKERSFLQAIAVRSMPAFSAGQALGFRTRVCPTVRTHFQGERPLEKDKKGMSKAREMDAWLVEALRQGPSAQVDREQVYSDWLRRHFANETACALQSARLVEFRREQMRRQGATNKKSVERPNAVLEGTLTVGEPSAFHALLARGVGRHRSFGFGMLLLRPA